LTISFMGVFPAADQSDAPTAHRDNPPVANVGYGPT
jgi:hypothetical protein